jgi:hypothetical protein
MSLGMVNLPSVPCAHLIDRGQGASGLLGHGAASATQIPSDPAGQNDGGYFVPETHRSEGWGLFRLARNSSAEGELKMGGAIFGTQRKSSP